MQLSLTKLFRAYTAHWVLLFSLSAMVAVPISSATAQLSPPTDCVNNPTPPPGISPAAITVARGTNAVSLTVSGCTGGYVSYFGTDGASRSVVGGIISVPTSATGVYTISAICTNNNCRSQAVISTVTVRPSNVVTGPAPTVANPITTKSGVVGTGFTFLIPTNTFQDATGNPLTLTVSGLPSGLFFNGLIITGSLTTADTFPITVTAANADGASISTVFSLVVSPDTGGLQLTTPTYNPCSRAIVFNTAGGDGTPISFTAVGVQRSSPQSTTGIVESGTATTGSSITILAAQSGQTVSLTFTPTPCVTASASGTALKLTTPTYNPCSRAIVFNTTGGDSTPISFTAVGVQRSSPQSTTGIVDAAIAANGSSVIIIAAQSGQTVSIAFAPTPCLTGPTPTTALQLKTPTYDPCSRAIVFNTTGGDNTPISFTAVGVQRSSPQSTTGVVDAAVVTDNKTLIIVASQSGQTISTVFTPVACFSVTPTIPLQLTSPTYNPCSRAIVFNTTGGDGTPISFTAVGVQRSSPLSTTGIVDSTTATTASSVVIIAAQSGQTVSLTFTTTPCVTSPPSGTALQLTSPTYNPCSRAIVFNTTGGDNTPISFTAVGVQRSSPQSTTGIVDSTTATTASSVTIIAAQNGRIVSLTFTTTPCVTAPPSGTALQLTLPTYDPCSRAIVFNTTGGDNTPISFTAVGVQRSSPLSTTGVVDAAIATNGNSLVIIATQSGQTVFTLFTPARCGGRSEATTESIEPLAIRVLGNPVQGPEVGVEITGAQGQPLQVRLLDAQGRLQFSHEVGEAAPVESITVPVGSLKAGILLFQAITPGRVSVVKLLKAW